MRKMATIRKIDAIRPIDGADAIECAVVGGWTVVVKKGEFAVGDLAIYCEIDSWIPTELAPFLSKGKEPREYEGVKGERLRTVKLRGQLSQGLLLPLFYSRSEKSWCFHPSMHYLPEHVEEGQDVTERLGIRKWEMPIPAQLAGDVKGAFPSVVPKTDQERCQNLVEEIVGANEAGMKFEITEKLEGSSMTCYLIDGEFGVCSRNLDLKRSESNSMWAVAIEQDIEGVMREVGDNFALQGELIGPGIQGNIYKLSKPEFHIFDIYSVAEGRYLDPAERRGLVEMMGLKHVPVLVAAGSLYDTLGITDIPQLLKFAEGKSKLNEKQEREGVVFKEVGGGFTFKAISNKYLLGEK
jgi:RNA ligase (TIGR02306 family)